jgi:RimJ/RimL family protein N-acetyltransferase
VTTTVQSPDNDALFRSGAFRFRLITESDARQISEWTYDPPYDFYDFDPSDWPLILDPSAGFVAVDADPALLPTVVNDEDEADWQLVGYICLGQNAQVPGGYQAGIYRERATDLGLGLRPELTGHGLGETFVRAAVAYAQAQSGGLPVRLVVATFNRRAITVYQRAGFESGVRFFSQTRDRMIEYLVMVRR